jgi:AcrR family transcriptional regulator
VTRPADLTRRSLIDGAIDVFAAKGYEGGSVRAITQRANANQAAINYHFGSKEGLYRAVLRLAMEAFSERTVLTPAAIDAIERDEALRLFVRQQLLPLLHNRRAQRYVRIFAWESVSPSKVFQEYIAKEEIPALVLAEKIVRRYAADSASREEIMVKAIWLAQQASPFVRNFSALSRAPMNLAVDAPFIERLIETLSSLAIAALAGTAPAPKTTPVRQFEPVGSAAA